MKRSRSNRSGSSTGDPHTPPQPNRFKQAKTRSFTEPSKPTKGTTKEIVASHSLSQPQTPVDSTETSELSTFDWGGSEWSRIIQDIKMQKSTTPAATELHEDDQQQQEQLLTTSSDDTNSSGKRSADPGWVVESISEAMGHATEKGASKDDVDANNALESKIQTTESSDTEYDSDSDSNLSVVHITALPTPNLSPPRHSAEEESHSPLKTARPSPQTILRGLIRDAHREMMYFTLPHSSFSLDDLRDGLEYAFGMLQAATMKLAMLAALFDETAEFQVTELRSWIDLIDRLDPQTCYEPRMPVVLECLSAGEIRLALAELVQSRVIVEDEIKRMKLLLERKTEDMERKMALQMREDDDAALDAWMTAIMVVVIGALYMAVR